jgi:hypothetical protein
VNSQRPSNKMKALTAAELPVQFPLRNLRGCLNRPDLAILQSRIKKRVMK